MIEANQRASVRALVDRSIESAEPPFNGLETLELAAVSQFAWMS
jgi:hypothetical protein